MSAVEKKRQRDSSGTGEDSVFLERKEERKDSRKLDNEDMMMVILEKINSAKVDTEKSIVDRIEKAKTETVIAFKDEISTIHSTLHDLQVSNDKLIKDNETLKKEVERQRGEIEDLKGVVKLQGAQIGDFAQYSRSDNVKIYGLPEEGGERGETEVQTARVVRELFKHRLGLTVQASDISIAHRLQARDGNHKPRTVIVKFTKRTTKVDVLANRKKLKDTPIVIAEDLSPSNMRLFHKMRDIAGNRNTWSHDGKILVKLGTQTIRVTTENVNEVTKQVMEWESGQVDNRSGGHGGRGGWDRERGRERDRESDRERGDRGRWDERAPRGRRDSREASPGAGPVPQGGQRVRSLSLGHDTFSQDWPRLGHDHDRDRGAWRERGGGQRDFGGGRGRAGGGRGRGRGGGGRGRR